MLINGQQSSGISAMDRGLLYGDGLFETIRIRQGEPVLFEEHLARLNRGCATLGLPLSRAVLDAELALLLQSPPAEAILKILITRGEGGRGYAPPQTASPTRILQIHPLPADYQDGAQSRSGITVMICRHRLSTNPDLAGLKHLNRLDQVLAAMELAERTHELTSKRQEEAESLEEALMTDGRYLIEASRSNLFVGFGDELVTPELGSSGVEGIMRNYLLEQLPAVGVKASTARISPEDLEQATELFLCNSVFGIWPVKKLLKNATVLQWPIGPTTRRAQNLLKKTINL